MFTAGLCLLTVVSCQTKQGTGTLVGTGAGAVIGGIVGNLIGKNTKGTAIGAAVGAAVGAGAGTLIGRHMDKVAEEAASNVNNAKVETVTDANGLPCVKLTFASGLLFATNKSDLSSGAMSDLSRTATVLKGNTDCDVAIIGHTDKSGNDNINIPLSQRRAESVANYLKAQGVSYGQIRSIQGVGSSQPAPCPAKPPTWRWTAWSAAPCSRSAPVLRKALLRRHIIKKPPDLRSFEQRSGGLIFFSVLSPFAEAQGLCGPRRELGEFPRRWPWASKAMPGMMAQSTEA